MQRLPNGKYGRARRQCTQVLQVQDHLGHITVVQDGRNGTADLPALPTLRMLEPWG